jgi:hypothetical protein
MGLQKPIAKAIATPIPIPMIDIQSEHDLCLAPHIWIRFPLICELISKGHHKGSMTRRIT